MKTHLEIIRKLLVNGQITKRNGLRFSEATVTTYSTILRNLQTLGDNVAEIRSNLRSTVESVSEVQYVSVLKWALKQANESLGTDYDVSGKVWNLVSEEFDMFIPEHERVVKMIHEFSPKTEIDKKAFRFIKVAAISGARYSDMKSWRRDTNIVNGNLVYIPQKKGSKQIVIPLNDMLTECFGESQLLPKIPYSTLMKAVKDIFMRSGFTNEIIRTRRKNGKLVPEKKFEYEMMGLHRLRASAITGMLQSGMGVLEVKSFSGHSFDSKSFKRYVSFSQSHLSEKFNRFSSGI